MRNLDNNMRKKNKTRFVIANIIAIFLFAILFMVTDNTFRATLLSGIDFIELVIKKDDMAETVPAPKNTVSHTEEQNYNEIYNSFYENYPQFESVGISSESKK